MDKKVKISKSPKILLFRLLPVLNSYFECNYNALIEKVMFYKKKQVILNVKDL